MSRRTPERDRLRMLGRQRMREEGRERRENDPAERRFREAFLGRTYGTFRVVGTQVDDTISVRVRMYRMTLDDGRTTREWAEPLNRALVDTPGAEARVFARINRDLQPIPQLSASPAPGSRMR